MAIASSFGVISAPPKTAKLAQIRGSRLVTRAAVRDLGSINVDEIGTLTTIRSSCAQKSIHQWLGRKYEECIRPVEKLAKVSGFRGQKERMWKGKKYTVGAGPVLDNVETAELPKTKPVQMQWKGKTYTVNKAAWEPTYVSSKYLAADDQ